MKPEAIGIKGINIENGLNVRLLQTGKFKTNVIAVLLRGELTRENATKNALLAGILRCGCEKYPSARRIALRCEELYGAALEVNVVKKGEEHIIQLYFESVKDGGVLEQAGELLHNILFRPLVTNGGFTEHTEAQKERLRQTIAGKINDKRKYARERMIEIMCEKERFGVPGDGCEKELYGLNAKNMLAHYNGVIANSPIEIGIIGDLGEERAKGWADKYFKRKSSDITEPKASPPAYAPKRMREVTEKAQVSQSRLVIGCRCAAPPIGRDFYTLLLFSEILGGSSSSRFFRNIREKRSLCYYIGSFVYRARSIMVIEAGIGAADYKKARDLIIAELRQAGEGGIEPWELEQARAALINQLETQKDSPQGLMDFYMSGALLGDNTNIEEAREMIADISEAEVSVAARRTAADTAFFLAGQ